MTVNELTTIYTSVPTPIDTAPDLRLPLAAFVKANFVPRIHVVGALVSGLTRQITVEMEAWSVHNEQELSNLVETYLSGDLITIADAAAACNVGIKRISAAVSVGALRGYTNPAAPNPRKGGTLVSLAACKQKWGNDE